MISQVVLATSNRGKQAEFTAGLDGIFRDLLLLPSDVVMPEETGVSFMENALLKAHAVAKQTGLPALADDSGLVVDALNGEPGVLSARYAGADATDEDNIARLLARMADIPDGRRTARFVAALALVFPNGRKVVSRGECEGQITRTPSGTEGFGYDPVFFYPPLGCTLAEISMEQKNEISHRAEALALMKEKLISPKAGR